jgi:type IV secretion system protein VirB8
LWSDGEARTRYIADTQASNPLSPLATLPRRTLVEVEVRSISSLNTETALIRFSTIRTDPGGQRQEPQPWAAVVKYRFSGNAMSAADRLTNPLGFQVIRYRRDAEMLPAEQVASPAVSTAPTRAMETITVTRVRP